MSASPFHGIFSAFTQSRSTKDEKELTLQESPLSEPVTSAKASAAEPQVGRVAVDIYEHDDYFIIKAPIAGVRLSDIDIEVNENVLILRGTRRQTDTIEQKSYHLQECFWGSFARRITLPTNIDPRKIKATFNKECVLKILVPKEERVKVVRINEA